MYGLTSLYTGISPIRLASIISYSYACHEMPGAFAEFGVMKAGSLELLAKIHPERKIYGIDSFEGLPDPTIKDVHTKGDFALTDQEYQDMFMFFVRNHPNVEIVRGFSPKVFLPDEGVNPIPEDAVYGFVHVDVDLYSSVNDALDYFFPRMIPGGVMLIDDYGFNTTPGCKLAVDEFKKQVQYRGEVDLPGFCLTGQYLIIK